ncbi:hypothetical protein BOO86_02970 [Mycobacterium sp. CBMA 234]|uniref:hypothetical protein n=1 Tax=Mycolicibacterium sp. CBMA 234 TaxID=1918495 RepID=UPI0028156D45|nr:hypothetical protein [Mycolicibacterium sp. CBMA 234]MUL63416.1 hypothetical protein [Mycolicibacterium sp. CBMA 234]
MTSHVRVSDASATGPTSNGDATLDNRLALLDQGFYAGHRAAGQKEVMQVCWLYERPVDLEGLKRLHQNLNRGMLGRLIERSPLPFGRYRWVAAQRAADIDIAPQARPRAEVTDWFDERSQWPVDPESGPNWQLAILPVTDGSTAISLVMSHYVMDGIGAAVEVVQAILGVGNRPDYPAPGSRTRRQALLEDARQAARDVPGAARALVEAAKEARRRQREDPRTDGSRPAAVIGAAGDEHVVLPGVSAWVAIDDWEARAKALGGVTNTLAAAVTAKLGDATGFRHGGDGKVCVQTIVNDRTFGDTRAVAVSFARVRVDPTVVTTDLSGVRADTKQALQAAKEAPDDSAQLAALTPFTPNKLWSQLVNWALDDPDHPVVCSNFGDVGWDISRPDGTQCAYGFARGTRQHATRQWLERIGGQLQVQFLTAPALGKVCIHVLAYQPGGVTTKAALRDLVARTLTEFDLTGEID